MISWNGNAYIFGTYGVNEFDFRMINWKDV